MGTAVPPWYTRKRHSCGPASAKCIIEVATAWGCGSAATRATMGRSIDALFGQLSSS